MKLRELKEPKSSFLAMEKDLSLITSCMLKNNNFKKLLHYTTPDALKRANLTPEEDLELLGNEIKIVPKLEVDDKVLNYVIIGFDNFTPNATNPEFRDSILTFDIVCHFDQWQLKDFQLRPYKIAGEIDTMFNERHLTGIGVLHFLGASKIVLNSELAGLTIMYQVINGEEDNKKPLNPNDEDMIAENFSALFG